MTRHPQPTRLYLTERALADIDAMDAHSRAEWGKRAAHKHLAQIVQTRQLVRDHPGLLQSLPVSHTAFRVYRTGRHVLMCDCQPQAIYVLTLLHTSRDIPNRLVELEPTLVAEAELLHQRLGSK